jgi:hypothetical protein
VADLLKANRAWCMSILSQLVDFARSSIFARAAFPADFEAVFRSASPSLTSLVEAGSIDAIETSTGTGSSEAR